MNYELIKKLKEAGFRQTGSGKYIPEKNAKEEVLLDDGEDKITEFRQEDWVKVPTLSELIEACGASFDSLTFGNRMNGTLTGWFATGGEDPTEVYEEQGDTPEEAVARLWLILNK